MFKKGNKVSIHGDSLKYYKGDINEWEVVSLFSKGGEDIYTAWQIKNIETGLATYVYQRDLKLLERETPTVEFQGV